jgi:succinate dehydrogenase / fumarate reductase cytochrome b subunit
MTSRKPPLSPHIQIYKPQISSFTSILHRLTGAFLYIGMIVICWAIVHYAYQIDVMSEGEAICDCAWEEVLKIFFYLVVIGWSFSLYYHLCNGIRHLFWDIGKGFDIVTAKRNGLLVIAISILMTIASVVFVLFFQNI